MAITIPLLFVVIGLLLYALATNQKVVFVGQSMYVCGMLAFLLRGTENLWKPLL